MDNIFKVFQTGALAAQLIRNFFVSSPKFGRGSYEWIWLQRGMHHHIYQLYCILLKKRLCISFLIDHQWLLTGAAVEVAPPFFWQNAFFERHSAFILSPFSKISR
ncbi:maternal embryonic leucine zipper kinase [Echinococcus multilocularis]|uniref:Maternal embryonic leucine zipper kinase n=1 Tax=Echinococcus multilocularis TaxID=6211 RepID=A0A0S4MLV2_ECHMU|nr:maternal embryonic leucine zipper kinase [Echinococcus multilocularis]